MKEDLESKREKYSATVDEMNSAATEVTVKMKAEIVELRCIHRTASLARGVYTNIPHAPRVPGYHRSPTARRFGAWGGHQKACATAARKHGSLDIQMLRKSSWSSWSSIRMSWWKRPKLGTLWRECFMRSRQGRMKWPASPSLHSGLFKMSRLVLCSHGKSSTTC